jgi:hypothetical protein
MKISKFKNRINDSFYGIGILFIFFGVFFLLNGLTHAADKIIKHITVSNFSTQSLPDFQGNLEDLIDVSVGKKELLICASGPTGDKNYFSIFFYLVNGPGNYKILSRQDYINEVETINPGQDWVSVWKCSRDQTFQLAVQLLPGCCGNGVVLFSFDPISETVVSLEQPSPNIEFRDLSGDGVFEIIGGEKRTDATGVADTPRIFNIASSRFIDVSNQYPDFYRSLIKDDEAYLSQAMTSVSFNETRELNVKKLVLRAYNYGGLNSEGKSYGENLIQDVNQRISNNPVSYEKDSLKIYLKSVQLELKRFDEKKGQ